MAIGAQYDEGRAVSPWHAPERKELRVGLSFGQSLPQVCRASDIERVAVTQPSLLVQLFHFLPELDVAFFLAVLLFRQEVHPFERESLVVERHGFFELGVGREADAELGDVGRVVFFRPCRYPIRWPRYGNCRCRPDGHVCLPAGHR